MTNRRRLFCGCARAHHARGLCTAHYARWLRTGDIRADVPIATREVRLCGCAEPELDGARCSGCGRPNLAAMLQIGRETFAAGIPVGHLAAVVPL